MDTFPSGKEEKIIDSPWIKKASTTEMYPESKLRIESLLSGGDSGEKKKKKYSLFCNSCESVGVIITLPNSAEKQQPATRKPPNSSGLFST